MWSEVFSAEEGGGVATSLKVEGDRLLIRHTQDVEGILDANAALRNDRAATTLANGNMHHVASVPMIVLQTWAKEAGVKMDDPAFKEVVKRKLCDPDWAKVRTREGSL